MEKVIENVVLTEIREDGAQKWTWGDDPVRNTLWLKGAGCVRSPRIGQTGRLVYHTTPSSGLYYYEPTHGTEGEP